MKSTRSTANWIHVIFLCIAIVLMLVGQTMAIFNYDWTVSVGLQEDPDKVGEAIKQVNRAFGAGDTIVYTPLLALSLAGLWLRRRWALIATAAAAGASLYWTATVSFAFWFLPGTPGYSHTPPPEVWVFIAVFFIFGFWSLGYLLSRGDRLLK
ncbi:hypothetical protein H8E52_04135 [bacterium]|nr:hypothetical protein [bacterium]